MPITWSTLHAHLLDATRRPRARRAFAEVAGAEPALASHPDAGALLAALHAPGGDPDARNGRLAALVRVAQGDGDGADLALTLALLALWPGLDAIRRRLARHHRARPDDLVSDLLAQAIGEIRTLRLDRVRRVAATVLRNVERDLRRGLAARWREAATTVALDAYGGCLPAPAAAPALGLPGPADTDTATAVVARRLSPAVGRDAPLVAAIAIGGLTQAEAGARIGLGEAAARKRYRRALARLRTAWAEAA